MLVKTYGSAVFGIDAQTITIETYYGSGQLNYVVVGLPDGAVRESLYRIEAAFKTCDLKMPRQRLVVNLAPADIKRKVQLMIYQWQLEYLVYQNKSISIY